MSVYLTQARINHIKLMAQQTLIKYSILAPPVDPKYIVQHLGDLYNFSDSDEKGFTRFINNKYKIYINNVEYRNMSIWTYAHEAGHIILDHFNKYDALLSNEIGCIYIDKEANAFAAELLMPEAWVYEYIKTCPPCTSGNLKKLIKAFDVSWDSMLNRLQTLKIQKKKDSLGVMNGIQTYDLRPALPTKPVDEYKTCTICGNNKNKTEAQYCFICGGYRFNSDAGVEYNDHITINHSGHAVVCPRCGNTEVAYDDYCDECDTYLYQKCAEDLLSIDVFGDKDYKSACDNIPSGNARYCEYCGNRTSFYKEGILVHWSKYKDNNINIAAEEVAATKGSLRTFLYGLTW